MTHFHIEEDIRKAHTVPSAWYRDPESYQHCLDTVFAPSWQVIPSHSNEHVLTPISLLQGSLNEPILIASVRPNSPQFAISNVCTHRGAVLVEEPCSPKEIRCPYHGRRFDLNGKCIHMPEFKEVEGFPSETDHLNRIQQTSFGPLTFISLRRPVAMSPSGGVPRSARDDNSLLSPLVERLIHLGLERAKHDPSHDTTFEVAAHWALYVENYLEGFHVPFVHKGLNAVLDYGSYETHVFDECVLQIGIAKEGELAFDLPPNHIDFGKRVAAFYYWLFPNTMINVYPWGISLNIIEPLGTERTRIRYQYFILDRNVFGQGAGSNLDTVEHEDDAIVERVQRGIRSRVYSRGRYSPTKEQGVHAFHRMLATKLSE